MGRSLNDIKRHIALLTLDIECLDPNSKYSAIAHLEETIALLNIGAGYDLATLANQNIPDKNQETKPQDDSSNKDDAWMFNEDTFVDDIDNESNDETLPVQEKEHHKNKSRMGQACYEEMGQVLNQIPNNETVNQDPVVISLNPDMFHGQIATINDILKCDPCNVYLPRSYTMKRHEEDPHHLARVGTVPPKHKEETSKDISSKVSTTN